MGWRSEVDRLHSRIESAFDAGAVITYEPFGLPELQVPGVFRANSLEVDVEGSIGVNSTDPHVGIRASRLPVEPTRKDHVRVGAPHFTPERRYEVKRADQDGEGWWTIFLTRAEELSP